MYTLAIDKHSYNTRYASNDLLTILIYNTSKYCIYKDFSYLNNVILEPSLVKKNLGDFASRIQDLA